MSIKKCSISCRKTSFSSALRESRPEGAKATRDSIISHIQEIPFHLTRYSRQETLPRTGLGT